MAPSANYRARDEPSSHWRGQLKPSACSFHWTIKTNWPRCFYQLPFRCSSHFHFSRIICSHVRASRIMRQFYLNHMSMTSYDTTRNKNTKIELNLTPCARLYHDKRAHFLCARREIDIAGYVSNNESQHKSMKSKLADAGSGEQAGWSGRPAGNEVLLFCWTRRAIRLGEPITSSLTMSHATTGPYSMVLNEAKFIQTSSVSSRMKFNDAQPNQIDNNNKITKVSLTESTSAMHFLMGTMYAYSDSFCSHYYVFIMSPGLE